MTHNVLPMSEGVRDPLGFDRLSTQPEIDPAAVEVFEKQAFELYELDKAIERLTRTKDGKRLFKFLRQNTIEAPTWMAGLGYQEAVAHGFAREGQNALVRDLEDRAARAKGVNSPEDYQTLLGVKGA